MINRRVVSVKLAKVAVVVVVDAADADVAGNIDQPLL